MAGTLFDNVVWIGARSASGLQPQAGRRRSTRGPLGPLLAQDRPDHEIVERPLRVHDLTCDPLEPAAALLRDPPRSDVARVHPDHDAVQRHPLEAEIDHRRGRFGHQALAPVRLADDVPKLSRAVLGVPIAIATGTDELALRLQLD